MRWPVRIILILLSLLFWVPVIGIGFEIYGFRQFKIKERHFNETNLRANQDIFNGREEWRKKYPQSSSIKPPDLRPPEESDFAHFFDAMTPEDRMEYASLKEVMLAFFNASAQVSDIYVAAEFEGMNSFRGKELIGKELASVLKADQLPIVKEAIARLYAGGTTETLDTVFANSNPARLYLYSLQDQNKVATNVIGLLDMREDTSKLAMVFPLFEVQWFKFKKNYSNSSDFVTNSFGFRDEEFVYPKPAHEYRVDCIGGSCVVEGSWNETTYPAILRKRLQAAFQDKPVTALNCGVHAHNTRQEKRRVYDYLALDPDLLITYNGQNDLSMVLSMAQNLEPLPGWKKLLGKSKWISFYTGSWLLPSDQTLRKSIDNQVIEPLKKMLACLKKHHVQLAICSFAYPDLPHCPKDEFDNFEWSTMKFFTEQHVNMAGYVHLMDIYNGMMKDFCAQNQLLYIPVAEEIKGTTNLFVDACHMTQLGTEQKADIVFKYLQPFIEKELAARPGS